MAARLSFSSHARAYQRRGAEIFLAGTPAVENPSVVAERAAGSELRITSATILPCREEFEPASRASICPYTYARYVFSTRRVLNSFLRYACIAGLFATSSTPLVVRSSRCTIPASGTRSPCGETHASPAFSSSGYRSMSHAATEGSAVRPSLWTISPAGLLSTSKSSVSAITVGTFFLCYWVNTSESRILSKAEITAARSNAVTAPGSPAGG